MRQGADLIVRWVCLRTLGECEVVGSPSPAWVRSIGYDVCVWYVCVQTAGV